MQPKFSVFVINLRSRLDRRREMERELASVGWHASFFEAIAPTEYAGFPSKGAHGCFLSHLGVLKSATACEMLVVLEDDMSFCRGFQERWANVVNSLPENWSLFYAGHVGLSRPDAGLVRLAHDTPVMGAHFMALSGRTISRLIDGLETIRHRPPGHAEGGPMHVDGAYSTIRAHNPDLITYAHFPPLGYQRPSRSDVSDRKWWFDRGVATPIGAALRRAKGALVRLRSPH